MVLHLHLRVELILQGKVEVAGLVVHANDRSEAKARLDAHQVDTLRILLQSLQAVDAWLCLGIESLELLHRVDTGSGGCLGLTELLVDAGDVVVDETVEVDVVHLALSVFQPYLDIVQTGLVGGITVEHAQTAVDRPVVIDLVGCTELESEVVLAATHVGIDVVALDTQSGSLQLMGNVAHGTLEGPQTLVVLADTAAAGH